MNNLSNIVNNQVERYIRETLKDKEGLLKELEEYAAEYNVPIVHKEVSDLLKVLLKFQKPKSILEVGCAIGYSSILFSITSIIRLKLCSNTPISSFFLLSTALILYSPFAISLDTLLNLTKGLVNFFDIIYIPADKIINIIKSIIMKNL